MEESQSASSSSELPCVSFNYRTYGLDKDGQLPPPGLFHCDLLFDDSDPVQASCYCAKPKKEDDQRMIIVSKIRSPFLLEHLCGMDKATSYHFTPKMDHMTFLGYFEDLFHQFNRRRGGFSWIEHVWMSLRVVGSAILKGIHDLFTNGFNHTLLRSGIAIFCGSRSLPAPKLFNFELTQRSPKDPEFIHKLILDLNALKDLVSRVFLMKGSIERVEPYYSQLNRYLGVDFGRCNATPCVDLPDSIVEPIMKTKIFDPFFWTVTDTMLFMRKMDQIFGKYPKVEISIKEGMGGTFKWTHLDMGVFKDAFHWDPSAHQTATQSSGSSAPPSSGSADPLLSFKEVSLFHLMLQLEGVPLLPQLPLKAVAELLPPLSLKEEESMFHCVLQPEVVPLLPLQHPCQHYLQKLDIKTGSSLTAGFIAI
ncbi:unnamed protein product [Cuscuta campestris]|uniref:Uncharacterized protein n=1 Tax=Cuscuta campestris TaxID=132261 RepID=A0A484NF40_9ASTE|nr:unnamed protein product [Cuscuta campestris]